MRDEEGHQTETTTTQNTLIKNPAKHSPADASEVADTLIDTIIKDMNLPIGMRMIIRKDINTWRLISSGLGGRLNDDKEAESETPWSMTRPAVDTTTIEDVPNMPDLKPDVPVKVNKQAGEEDNDYIEVEEVEVIELDVEEEIEVIELDVEEEIEELMTDKSNTHEDKKKYQEKIEEEKNMGFSEPDDTEQENELIGFLNLWIDGEAVAPEQQEVTEEDVKKVLIDMVPSKEEASGIPSGGCSGGGVFLDSTDIKDLQERKYQMELEDTKYSDVIILEDNPYYEEKPVIRNDPSVETRLILID